MHIRPYQPHDSLALASIKAHCDLSDPLALFCRRQPPSGSQTACDKQWREHIKSLRRSLELELLLSGTVCWVVVLDDDDDDDDNENDHNRNQSDKDYADTENQSIVGFALWNRYGFSSEAREWKAEGCRLSRRMKALLSYMRMIITYPFDTSIDHTHMAKFHQRIRSSDQQHNNQEPAKERWELEALYIHPRYQRRGYGSSALLWGIETARKENVEIWVWSTLAGKRMYAKAGFVNVGRIGFEDLITAADDEDQREREGVAIWIMVWRGS